MVAKIKEADDDDDDFRSNSSNIICAGSLINHFDVINRSDGRRNSLDDMLLA